MRVYTVDILGSPNCDSLGDFLVKVKYLIQKSRHINERGVSIIWYQDQIIWSYNPEVPGLLDQILVI